MSNSKSGEAAESIDTGGFTEMAKGAMSEGGGGSWLPDATDVFGGDVPGPVKSIGKRLIRPSAEGQTVEDIQEQLGCGEGPAYTVRGLERATGIDDVPPIAEMAIGLLKTVRGE